MPLEIIAESPHSILAAIERHAHTPLDSGDKERRLNALLRGEIIGAHFDRLLPVMNSNTVSTDLKRTIILQQMIRAFAIKVLNLLAFATRFDGVRLEGTDKVAVPYFPLITTPSLDFSAVTGYITPVSTSSDAKTITADKRKYQMLAWTSAELARQPFLDVAEAARLTAEQLGLDVVNDILSAITVLNFGAAVVAVPAAAFSSDTAADLKGVADTANWPTGGRSLVLNSAYDVSLLKDQAVELAYAWGDAGPAREGRIVRIQGFDYFPDARVPANGENLQGFICSKSAMLVAFAPVTPTDEVRNQLLSYELVVEPTTGATFEFRRWGDPNLDVSKQIIEANYGYAAGEPTALKRITS